MHSHIFGPFYYLPTAGCPAADVILSNQCLWPRGEAKCSKCTHTGEHAGLPIGQAVGANVTNEPCRPWDEAYTTPLVMGVAASVQTFADLRAPVCYDRVVMGAPRGPWPLNHRAAERHLLHHELPQPTRQVCT